MTVFGRLDRKAVSSVCDAGNLLPGVADCNVHYLQRVQKKFRAFGLKYSHVAFHHSIFGTVLLLGDHTLSKIMSVVKGSLLTF